MQHIVWTVRPYLHRVSPWSGPSYISMPCYHLVSNKKTHVLASFSQMSNFSSNAELQFEFGRHSAYSLRINSKVSGTYRIRVSSTSRQAAWPGWNSPPSSGSPRPRPRRLPPQGFSFSPTHQPTCRLPSSQPAVDGCVVPRVCVRVSRLSPPHACFVSIRMFRH